ncbi:MAG: peptide ABC transporter substrate-binding protein [Treponema sp.]|jgi:peptide/nickel transport system substrate-binding protein/oligopeptide transport system substrate-binding protein|nr:peptide ABC transporter substrate-binding protein [Treponema sp.]
MILSNLRNFSLSGLPHKFSASAMMILLSVSLAACQGFPGAWRGGSGGNLHIGAEQQEAASGVTNFARIRPAPASQEEIAVAFSGGMPQLDFRISYLASEAQLFTALYEGLFSHRLSTMEPVPAAASSWTLSEDRREWTFTIRENARFSNGDPLRAEDFRASWLSMIDPERNTPYSSLFDIIEGARDFRLGYAALEDVGIFAPQERTLVVRLNSPISFFPSMLCHHAFAPIHPSMVYEENWLERLPVSNGAFYISEVSGDRLIFSRNPYYWDVQNVSLSTIIIRLVESGTEASQLWNSGEVRWIQGEVDFDTLMDRSNIHANPLFATHYYFVRSSREPWNDFRLRRALSLVLPWEQLRQGHFLPAPTLIFPIPGYPSVRGLDTFDAEQARFLFTEAGFQGGRGLPELVIRIPPSGEAQRIASIMSRAWNEYLGVRVRIDVVPFADYLASLRRDDFDVGTITWIGDFADPWTFLKMWSRDSNLNYAAHSDDDFEALLERSMTEEGAQRWETLAEAETLLLERGNVLPISFSIALNIIDLNEIEGWVPNLLNIHPFKYMSFRERQPLPQVVLEREQFQYMVRRQLLP